MALSPRRSRRIERAPPRTAVPRPSRFTASAPPFLFTTGDESWGKRKPVDGNASPAPLGSKAGSAAAGAAAPLLLSRAPLPERKEEEEEGSFLENPLPFCVFARSI